MEISVDPFGPNALALSNLTDKYANPTNKGKVEDIEALVKNLIVSMRQFGITPTFAQQGTKAQAEKQHAEKKRQKESERLHAQKEKERKKSEAVKQRAEKKRQQELERLQAEKEKARRKSEAAKQKAEKKRQQELARQRAKADKIRRIREIGFNIKTSLQGKQLLKDLEAFVQKNPTTLDPRNFVKLYSHAKEETDQAWFAEDSINFKKLVSYLSQNPYFSSYRMKLMKGRLAIIGQRKLSAIRKIKIGLGQIKT